MPYTIPNDATASFPDQATPDAGDFAVLGGISGVQSGGAVTANGTNMTLTVASSFVLVNGVPLVNGGGSAVIGAASANPRWDIVYINASNVITVLAGSPASTNAMLPVLDPVNGVVLVAVYIPTSTSALQSTHLIDKRKQTDPALQRISASPSDTLIRSKDDGDSTDRYKVTIDGKAVWTSGAAGTPNPTLGFDATLAGLLLTGKLGATASVATETPLTVTAAGSQSVDIVKIRSSAPADLVRIDSGGILTAPNIKRGAGAPNGAVTGIVGDMYQQTDGANGATLWIKETGSGNTGWNACGTTSAGLVLGGGQIATGCILEYPAGALPGGFLWCDGSAVSRSTYSALFALWNINFGAGDGSTTFNVIDKRGIVTAGTQNFGAGTTISNTDRQIGATVGATAGVLNRQLTNTELPVHSHGINDAGHSHKYTRPIDSQFVTGGGSGPVAVTAATTPNQADAVVVGTGISIQNQGAGGAFSILQPTQLSRFIVKY